MMQKMRLTPISAVVILAIGLAGCRSQPTVTPTTPATLPPPTLTAPRPSPTANPPTPTRTAVPPTKTPLPPTAAPTSMPPTSPPSAKVIVKLLNVRSGPGTNYPIVAVINEGVVLTVIGRSTDNLWIAVKAADNTAGWCSAQSKYVSLSVDVNQLAIVPNPAAPPAARTATAPPSPSPTR